MENYLLSDNKIIFKPDFNEPIDKYFEIISKCNGIIFGNYDELEIVLETNNIYNVKYDNNYKDSLFNQKIILSNKIINLFFSNCFNQNIILPNTIINLTFGPKFNQNIVIKQDFGKKSKSFFISYNTKN